MKIKFIEDDGKVFEARPDYILACSRISKIKDDDDDKTEYFINIWYKNGKRRLLRTYNKTKLMLFHSKLWFQRNKEQIKNDLQNALG